MTGRTWNYHGMNHKVLKNANVCSAQVLAASHFRQKRPQRRYTAKCSSRADDHILSRGDCNGDLGVFAAWWSTRSGPHVHGVFQFNIDLPKVFLFQFLPVRDSVRQFMKSWSDILEPCIRTFGKMVGQCTTVHQEVVIVQCSS